MLTLNIIQKIAIWILPVLFAITLHEAAHALAANYFGDTTAKMFGRLSINPIRHVDPVGSILIPILVGVVTQFQFVFGWAKPVPINNRMFKNPRRDTAIVSAAGPIANLIMAIMWAGCYKIAMSFDPSSSNIALFTLLTAKAGININLLLAFLNLLPIPPLDGSKIMAIFLTPRQADRYLKLERYGFLILLALLVTNTLSLLLNPLIMMSIDILKTVFNI